MARPAPAAVAEDYSRVITAVAAARSADGRHLDSAPHRLVPAPEPQAAAA